MRPSVPVGVMRLDYSSTNVTTGAYVQLSAAGVPEANHMEIFDSSGKVLKLAVGASGAEKDLGFYIIPGGQGPIAVQLSAGQRLAIKAVDGDATSGQLVINFYK